MRCAMLRLLASLIFMALLVACGRTPAATPAAEVTRPPGQNPTATSLTPTFSPTSAGPVGLRDCEVLEPPGRCAKIDVGGYQLWIVCRGSGSPTIVLEAGFGGDSRSWNRVIQDLAVISQVCVYDRAGLGSSDPPSQPARTS